MDSKEAHNTRPDSLPFGGFGQAFRRLSISSHEDMFSRTVNILTLRSGTASGWTPINKPKRDHILLAPKNPSRVTKSRSTVNIRATNENVVQVLEKCFITTGRETMEPAADDLEPANFEAPNKKTANICPEIPVEVDTDQTEDDTNDDEEMEDEEHGLYTLLGLSFLNEEEVADGTR